MNTNTLTDAALDWAVCVVEYGYGADYQTHRFSSDWAFGGPIIEREGIDVLVEQRDLKIWAAEIYVSPRGYIRQRGTSPLSAAMRCYVASKLGNEVDVPKELQGETA